MAGHDVFISHASPNKAIADAICARLEQAGIRCWIAPRDIPAGTTWAGAITRAIRECRLMVLVFSAAGNESPYVLREVTGASDFRKPILAFRTEEVTPSDDLYLHLTAQHWLNAHQGSLEERIAELVTATRSLLMAPLPTQPATPKQLGAIGEGSLAQRLHAARTAWEPRFTSIIESLRNVAKQLRELECAARLGVLAGRFDRDDLFSIAAFGRMKAGKSTLLNALACHDGTSPLPADDLPCTSTLIKLRSANNTYYQPFAWERSLNTIGGPLPLATSANFQSWISEVMEEGYISGKEIGAWEIGWPSLLLRQGVVIIDTPGMTEDAEERMELTRKVLTGVDVAISMFRSIPFAGTDEIEFAKQVAAGVSRILTVVNLRHEDNLDPRFETIIRRRLNLADSQPLEDQNVFVFNCQEALNATVKKTEPPWGFRQLEARLAEILLSGPYRAAQLKAIGEAATFAGLLQGAVRHSNLDHSRTLVPMINDAKSTLSQLAMETA